MYEEQQRDRDALRLAQDKAKLDHKDWAKQLYAEARKTAYHRVHEEFAGKWEAVRTIEDLKEREKAAAALKLEEKKSYDEEAARQVDKRRPEKDAAWKSMRAPQDKERLELRAQHQQETAALARQHIAERLGVHEKWRALNLDRQANRIDARLTAHQGMAAQQKAALDAIKLHARATPSGKTNEPSAAPANPREAARGYFGTARAEEAKHEAIRDKLLETRAQNLKCAGIAADKSQDPSAQRQNTDKGRAAANGAAAGKGGPRETLAPGIRAARGNRSSSVQQHFAEHDPQQQIHQAVESGRSLTDAERANTSPEVREQLGRDERKANERSQFTPGSTQQQRGKDGGRSGGGRGR